MVKWNRGLRVLGAAAVGVLVLARVASASADVTTEQSGSILVWPKVVWDGTRDTIIQLTNTGNPTVQAHCFYVNAAPSVNPCAPASSQNPAQWLETDFDLFLTKQQPTHWVVSTGRQTNTFDSGDGAGFDPGLIPPVPLCFQGELKCIQTDPSNAPYPGNSLKGEATIRYSDGDVSKYNAIAFLGNTNLQNSASIGTDLQLNLTDGNPGGEYSACPDRLLVNHFAYGSPDLVNEGTVNTNLTLVPCQENFETQTAGKVTVQFQIFNEFEQPFSASTTVNCWLDAPLSTLTNNQATFNVLGTIGAFTRIHPNPGKCSVTTPQVCLNGQNKGQGCGSDDDCPGDGGVIGVAEEFHSGAAAAFNLNVEGNRFDSATDDDGKPLVGGVVDHIVIPSDSAQ